MAKKAAKRIGNTLLGLLVLLAAAYSVCMRVWPQQTTQLVGYRFYTVITGSMEPTIPTTSMVLVRCLKPDETPRPGQIVTFTADRLGDEIVLTHYLREVKPDETGRLRFYTQGESADRYDDYATYRENLLGTYVLHIPYLGKVLSFLQSSNALSMLVTVWLILWVRKLLIKNMDLQEQLRLAGQHGEAAAETAAPDATGQSAKKTEGNAAKPPKKNKPPKQPKPEKPAKPRKEPKAGRPEKKQAGARRTWHAHPAPQPGPLRTPGLEYAYAGGEAAGPRQDRPAVPQPPARRWVYRS